MELKGNTAIITGGSLGIGATTAIELAREGANVAINYRKHDTEAKEVTKTIENLSLCLQNIDENESKTHRTLTEGKNS